MDNRLDPTQPSAPSPQTSGDPWRPVGSEDAPRHAYRPDPGPWMRIGIATMAALVIVAFATVAVFLGSRREAASPPILSATPSPTHQPSEQAPTPRPTPSGTVEPASPTPGVITTIVSPAPGGRSWSLPAATWDPLPPADPASPLYPMQVTALDALPPVAPTGCPEPSIVTTTKEWKLAVRAQWSCVHRAWRPIYEQLGWSSVEPEVMFYPGTGSKSDCGYLSAPAFYCSSGTGTVFFGQEHMDMATTWDLAVNEMVNHEYAHHVQKLAGITEAKLALPSSNEVERRSELQATCLSAMMTIHNRSFGFNADDFDSWRGRLDTMLIDTVHGNRASLIYWGTRGLYASTVGDCNTWVALAEDVA